MRHATTRHAEQFQISDCLRLLRLRPPVHQVFPWLLLGCRQTLPLPVSFRIPIVPCSLFHHAVDRELLANVALQQPRKLQTVSVIRYIVRVPLLSQLMEVISLRCRVKSRARVLRHCHRLRLRAILSKRSRTSDWLKLLCLRPLLLKVLPWLVPDHRQTLSLRVSFQMSTGPRSFTHSAASRDLLAKVPLQ
mmetsp:Transcript_25820/g.65093  ORF Transcript_25820/g.65093 Transcript_25820/m.65093 type:complete len:191 (-) Transcript_25820:314-886(-)